MDGYVFGVTGEGCGCVSMNVSGDTTSVTCSGWTAAGQICSFQVQTLSRDCRFISDPNSIIYTGKYCLNQRKHLQLLKQMLSYLCVHLLTTKLQGVQLLIAFMIIARSTNRQVRSLNSIKVCMV